MHYVNLKQAIQKLETDISNRYSKEFVHKTKQKVIEKIVFPYGNKIYIQSRSLAVTAVQFILFNFANYSPSIAMELEASKEFEITRK